MHPWGRRCCPERGAGERRGVSSQLPTGCPLGSALLIGVSSEDTASRRPSVTAPRGRSGSLPSLARPSHLVLSRAHPLPHWDRSRLSVLLDRGPLHGRVVPSPLAVPEGGCATGAQ